MNESRRPSQRRRKKFNDRPERVTNYRQLKHAFRPQEIFSADQINQLHLSALNVLKTMGIKVLLPEARKILLKAGAKVEDEMIYLDESIVQAALDSAPKSFRWRAANPERELLFAEGSMIFSPGGGCPNATDLIRGRRAGDLATYIEGIKLVQSFDVIHIFGPCVEPQDVPIDYRHYDMLSAQMVYGDKPMFTYARGREQVQQGFDMIRLGLDLSDDEFKNDVWVCTVINSNSPRMLDKPMAQGIIDFAKAGQLSIVTPFCLAGAMAPVTVAGALTLQHAEALMGITLAQTTRAGAPVSYGGFSSNVDMKSGSPAFGTPEHVKMQIGAGQLARHIGLPWRSAAGSAANTGDMQASHETVMSIWGASMANATLTLHSAGWLEGGLTFGFEKFINDIETLQSMAELAQPSLCSDEEIGLEAIAEVDPGGHYFSHQHTMERFATAFYPPLVADLSNFENWQEQGAKTATERATGIWQRVLNDFVAPSTAGEQVTERLMPYIESCKKVGGAAPME